MYYLENDKLHKEILKKLNSIKKPQRFLDNKKSSVISRSTLQRMRTGKPILMETYFKLIEWLEEEPMKFLKYKRENYEKNKIK